MTRITLLGEEHLFVAPKGSWTLTTALRELLDRAERSYGARRKSWTVLGAEIGSKTPNPGVWYPGAGRKHIAIRLAANASESWQEACFQLAHEVIHLLDPNGGGKAPIIEEGVATLFANQMSAEHEWGLITADPQYLYAASTVTRLLAIDPNAIAVLRTREPFHNMTPEMIVDMIGRCPIDLADELCQIV